MDYVLLLYYQSRIYRVVACSFFFFFNDTATTEIYTLSLHDALPIFQRVADRDPQRRQDGAGGRDVDEEGAGEDHRPDTAAQQQHGGERDAPRRPDGRPARVHHGGGEAPPGGDDGNDAHAQRHPQPRGPL